MSLRYFSNKKRPKGERGNYKNSKFDDIEFSDFHNDVVFCRLIDDEQSRQGDYLYFISWLMSHGLLLNSMKCDRCQTNCTLGKRTKNKDGYSWRCPSRKHEYSIRINSWFEHSHLALQDIMNICKLFVENHSLKSIATKSGISYSNTAVDWASYIRELLKEFWTHNLSEVQLPSDDIIEVDESFFGRRQKYMRGLNKTEIKIWVVGLISRKNNQMVMYPVDKRDASTLLWIIKRHCPIGSTIFTDGWAGYQGLNEEGYEHFTVNHKTSFKKTYINKVTGKKISNN